MRGADVGGGGRKIGFNTNHYMRSHIRGRGAEAEREQNPLRNKWVRHIFRVRFETAPQSIVVLKKWQIRPRPLRVCVNIPAVAERECQNPPVICERSLIPYMIRKHKWISGAEIIWTNICNLIHPWHFSGISAESYLWRPNSFERHFRKCENIIN